MQTTFDMIVNENKFIKKKNWFYFLS